MKDYAEGFRVEKPNRMYLVIAGRVVEKLWRMNDDDGYRSCEQCEI